MEFVFNSVPLVTPELVVTDEPASSARDMSGVYALITKDINYIKTCLQSHEALHRNFSEKNFYKP